MRTKNSIINAAVSICSQVLVLLVTLISRRIIIVYINSNLLGYEGLFKDLLLFLSFADLGIGQAIIFNLYKAVAEDNQDEIDNLMIIYKNMYMIMCVIIFALGLFMIPLLKYICKGTDISETYMYAIYIVQLLTVISTYLLAYKRVRFVTEQKEYYCIQIETGVNILAQIFKLLVLYILQNYIFYLLVTLIQNIITNILISYKHNKMFGKIPVKKVGLFEIKKRNLYSEMKNVTLHKVALYIYNGTDNILISSFLGVAKVTYLTNYTMVVNQVNTIFDSLFKPITASIGDLVYRENSEQSKDVLWGLDVLFYFLATFIAISVYVVQEPFIMLWVGEEYILPKSFLILMVINLYIGIGHRVFAYYRNTLGNYEMDRKYMLLSAAVNLVLSILLINKLGLTGVMLGTVVGHICIWYGRCYCIFKEYLKCSSKKYVVRQIMQFILFIFEFGCVVKIASYIPPSILGMFGRVGVTLFVTLGINLLAFYKTHYIMIIKRYIKQTIGTMKNIRGKNNGT